MKIVQEKFSVSTKSRNQMIDITAQVRSIVDESDISDGEVIVYCPHTTAAITINENADRPGYRHYEGNSDAHCKSTLVGCSEQVLLKDESLQLGTWQGIFFCEFDGPRSRKVIVQVRGQ